MKKKLTAFEIAAKIADLRATAERAKNQNHTAIEAACKKCIRLLQRRKKTADAREAAEVSA